MDGMMRFAIQFAWLFTNFTRVCVILLATTSNQPNVLCIATIDTTSQIMHVLCMKRQTRPYVLLLITSTYVCCVYLGTYHLLLSFQSTLVVGRYLLAYSVIISQQVPSQYRTKQAFNRLQLRKAAKYLWFFGR